MINPEPLPQSIIDDMERLRPFLLEMQAIAESFQPAIQAAEEMIRSREADLQCWLRMQ